VTAERLRLDPELIYAVVIAALNVVGSANANVYRRLDRDAERGYPSSRPTVSPVDLLALRDVLDLIPPGGLAARTIELETAARRRATRPEHRRSAT
jgi:hypothetical protein